MRTLSLLILIANVTTAFGYTPQALNIDFDVISNGSPQAAKIEINKTRLVPAYVVTEEIMNKLRPSLLKRIQENNEASGEAATVWSMHPPVSYSEKTGQLLSTDEDKEALDAMIEVLPLSKSADETAGLLSGIEFSKCKTDQKEKILPLVISIVEDENQVSLLPSNVYGPRLLAINLLGEFSQPKLSDSARQALKKASLSADKTTSQQAKVLLRNLDFMAQPIEEKVKQGMDQCRNMTYEEKYRALCNLAYTTPSMSELLGGLLVLFKDPDYEVVAYRIFRDTFKYNNHSSELSPDLVQKAKAQMDQLKKHYQAADAQKTLQEYQKNYGQKTVQDRSEYLKMLLELAPDVYKPELAKLKADPFWSEAAQKNP